MISRRGLLQKASSIAPVAAAGAVLGRFVPVATEGAAEEPIPAELPDFYAVNIKNGSFSVMQEVRDDAGKIMAWEPHALDPEYDVLYAQREGRVVKMMFVK